MPIESAEALRIYLGMTSMNTSIVRDLLEERAEALTDLALLAASYSQTSHPRAEQLRDELRRGRRPREDVFVEARTLYTDVISTFATDMEHSLIHKDSFLEDLERCKCFANAVAPRVVHELQVQLGRHEDLRRAQRQGTVAGDQERNRLRADILETLQHLVESARLPQALKLTQDDFRDTHADPCQETSANSRPVIGAASEEVLTCNKVTKRFRTSRLDALHEVTVSVRRGKILGVVGLNGSGKSTLLAILAGDLAATSGNVDWKGTLRKHIAFVPQKPPGWNDCFERHLRMQAAFHGLVGEKNDKPVRDVLMLFDLTSVAGYRYGELSAGMQTRCALAAALVGGPHVLILDEPLAALDPVAQYQFMADLHGHARYTMRQLPIVISSQHVEVVEAFADEILLLNDGRATYLGPTQEVGKAREENTFELRCSLGIDQLRRVLADLHPTEVRTRPNAFSEAARNLYTVRTRLDVSCRDIVNVLHKSNVDFSHLSDISCSALSILLSLGDIPVLHDDAREYG